MKNWWRKHIADETDGVPPPVWLMAWRLFVYVMAWILGIALFSILIYGCGAIVSEDNKRGDTIGQCKREGLRVEIIYGASGWAEDVYCFDRSTNELVRKYESD